MPKKSLMFRLDTRVEAPSLIKDSDDTFVDHRIEGQLYLDYECNSLVPSRTVFEIEKHQNPKTPYGSRISFVSVSLLVVGFFCIYFFVPRSFTPELDLSYSKYIPVACAKSLDVDFNALYMNVQKSHNFCGSETKGKNCHCLSPLIPQARVPNFPQYWERWDATFARNQGLATNSSNPDVVMIGDSITEHWLGTDLGEQNPNDMQVKKIFDKLFVNGDVHGLALGLAGDRCPQLLYRLKWGEMPDSLQPKIWWLLIGTNDLADYCSKETILVGTIGIVREIRKKRPDSTIVVNGILPRPDNAMGVLGTREHSFWKITSWINDRISCFTDGMDRVVFFNASDIFITTEGNIDLTLMPDCLHPNGKGGDKWGTAMVEKIKEILAQETNK